MTTKSELIRTILSEFRKAQEVGFTSNSSTNESHFPIMISDGNSRHYHATAELLESVSDYIDISISNMPVWKAQFKTDELRDIARTAFGATLSKTDFALNDDQLIENVKREVDSKISIAALQPVRDVDLILGCTLIQDADIYPVEIGPVRFERREIWLKNLAKVAKISDAIEQRILRQWAGHKLRKSKKGILEYQTLALLDAIGPCPIVCTVRINGLSGKMIEEKGPLAARLATAAISLMWNSPSSGIEWMNFHFDGRPFSAGYALLDMNGNIGSLKKISQLPTGFIGNATLAKNIVNYQYLFDQVGQVLAQLVQPNNPTTRASIQNALLMSLWWFGLGCREKSDQLAVVQFSSSLDALADGGKLHGIEQLIEARLGGLKVKNGRTSRSLIKEIYDAGRSRLLHGTTKTFAHDWANLRDEAENICRYCLLAVCDWMSHNPTSDDVAALRSK